MPRLPVVFDHQVAKATRAHGAAADEDSKLQTMAHAGHVGSASPTRVSRVNEERSRSCASLRSSHTCGHMAACHGSNRPRRWITVAARLSEAGSSSDRLPHWLVRHLGLKLAKSN